MKQIIIVVLCLGLWGIAYYDGYNSALTNETCKQETICFCPLSTTILEKCSCENKNALLRYEPNPEDNNPLIHFEILNK